MSQDLDIPKASYKGAASTLCTGCGHDSITNNIINALFLSQTPPHRVAKLSGIGCSSKTTNYFLNQSHGFNSIHGRMAPLATGAKIANHELIALGVSGDGDTASIGLGGFAHLIRRNLPMVYIVENNGVYGLTKGQFSATADKGTTKKGGGNNPLENIDICRFAIEVGGTFVARSFSGDNKQLTNILIAAFKHNGTAVIDVVSPCITFANHEGSTKSYNYVKDHLHPLNTLDFVPESQAISVDYPDGSQQHVQLPDGSHIVLSKVGADHNVSDKLKAMELLYKEQAQGQIATGLFYINESAETELNHQKLTKTPLAHLTQKELRPSDEWLNEALKEFS